MRRMKKNHQRHGPQGARRKQANDESPGQYLQVQARCHPLSNGKRKPEPICRDREGPIQSRAIQQDPTAPDEKARFARVNLKAPEARKEDLSRA